MKFQFERHRRTILTINITTIAQIIRTSIPAKMESKGDTIAIISSFLFQARSQTHLSPPNFEWPCFVQEFVL